MAIQYAGGTNINTTLAADTRTLLVDNLKAQLVNAGWTVKSGSSGNWTLESATTPANQSLKIRVRIYDPGSGNYARVQLRDEPELLVTQDHYLAAATGKVYRVIANKYQWFCFTPGSTQNDEFAAAGVPWIPPFLEGVITGGCGWIQSSGNGGGTVTKSWRISLGLVWHWAAILNGNKISCDWSNYSAGLRLVSVGSLCYWDIGGWRWHDDSLIVAEPLLAWGPVNLADEGKVRGQLWDAMMVSDAFTDSTISFDGKTWYAITYNNVGGGNDRARGTLFVLIP